MTHIAAIVFDLDQTLFDRQRVWDRWIAAEGVSHDDRMQLRELDCNGLGNREDFFAAYQSMTGRSIDQNHFAVSLSRFIEPDPELVVVLKSLRRDYRLAILTNGGETTQATKLHALSLDRIIRSDRTFVSSQIGFVKPDRRAFDFVASELGLEAKECLYFGDRLQSDIMAARAAGWKACQVSGPVDLRRRLSRMVEAAVC